MTEGNSMVLPGVTGHRTVWRNLTSLPPRYARFNKKLPVPTLLKEFKKIIKIRRSKTGGEKK